MGDTVVNSLASLNPYVRLYGPDGTLLSAQFGRYAAQVSFRATNSGTFTVVAANDDVSSSAGKGLYCITLAKTGSPIMVAPACLGGALTNGFTYQGNLLAGQLSVWNFDASAGESIVVGMGDTVVNSLASLNPYVRLYGPDGALLSAQFGRYAAQVSFRATNSGTFTVVGSNADEQFNGGYGSNQVTLAKTGSSIIVAPGNPGGPMTGARTNSGAMAAGVLHIWKLTACLGDAIVLEMDRITPSSLYPQLRLYGPDGALLTRVSGIPSAMISLSAPACGPFTIIASNDDANWDGGNGSYQLVTDNLSDTFKTCLEVVMRTNLITGAVGGLPGTTGVLFTTTNLAIPATLWVPITTNEFNSLGVFEFTNHFDVTEAQRYFRVFQP